MTTAKPLPSLHLRILNDVRENILSGAWRPGHRIQTETEMAATYGCSRMTVNKALVQLTRAGLLERTRKGGTFVKAPQSLSAAIEITNIRREVEDAGKSYSYRLLDDITRPASPTDAAFLGTEKSERVRQIACLHSANDSPFCYEERLINLGAVPQIDGVSFQDSPPGAWLLQQVPWNTAKHEISACAALPDIADILEVETGAACLIVERTTQNDKGRVTWAKLSYSGDQHRLFATFTPTDAGQTSL